MAAAAAAGTAVDVECVKERTRVGEERIDCRPGSKAVCKDER